MNLCRRIPVNALPSWGREGNVECVFWFQVENKLIMWKYDNRLRCRDQFCRLQNVCLWSSFVISSRRICPFIMHQHYWLACASLLGLKIICIIVYYFRLVKQTRCWVLMIKQAAVTAGKNSMSQAQKTTKSSFFLWHLSPAFTDPALYATWPQALFFLSVQT